MEDMEPASRIDVLHEESGVSRDIIKKVSASLQDTVSFDVADKLICTIIGPHLWWANEELASLYAVAVATMDKKKPIAYEALAA